MPDLESAALGTSQKAFAGYPAPFVFDAPGGKKIEHVIWGDYIGLTGNEQADFVEVRARGTTGWMKKTDVQQERLLEVNFVDVGQGDGCFVVTPDDKYLLIDAGEHDNMARFLTWRFNPSRRDDFGVEFDAAIITHSDADHYDGFRALLEAGNFHFKTVFHNGLVERSGDKRLGATEKLNGVTYQTEVIANLQELRAIIDDPAKVGRLHYPNLLKSAVNGGHADDVRMLSSSDGFVPGYEDDKELTIEVLAPVPENINNRVLLRRLGDDGITKNGHSVTLRFRYKDIDVLLGGDLNSAAQRYLLRSYTGQDPKNATDAQRDAMIQAAQQIFAAHAAKSCHHGSADFVDAFLGAVNAIVTVVSSGDNEPFAHPRPDALGALGKWGRGARPLIFSTELARSPNENVKRPQALRQQLDGLFWEYVAADTDLERERIKTEMDEQLSRIERSIGVYGLINLRSDGKRLLMAQKLERPSPSGTKWDVHRFEFENGELEYVP
jgi:beta-lactamase superfamily II metal-dependent hydrolase